MRLSGPRLGLRIETVAACLLVAAAATTVARAQPRPHLRSIWSGDPEKAVQLFADALAADPEDADAATNLGQALTRVGRRDEAERALREAIRLSPTRESAYALLADLIAEDPRRWERRDDVVALLKLGLDRVAADAAGQINLSIALANFERSIGRTEAARARLLSLDDARLSTEQRKRVLDLVDALRTEEQARALQDQPEPGLSPSLLAELAAADALLSAGSTQAALEASERLTRRLPAWRGPHRIRARALELVGRYDDAERELTVLLQLAPSNAEAWRRLGRILALHGGALDADRADEALRQALSLEPGWWDLWFLRAQVALRGGRLEEARRSLARYLREAPERADDGDVHRLLEAMQVRSNSAAASPNATTPAQKPPEPPTPKALSLYRDARAWWNLGDPDGEAPGLVAQALEESPGFIDAAALFYALTRRVPERTVHTLWNDAGALIELARKIRAIGRDQAARSLSRPWIDRALALGSVEARLEHALLRIEEGDRKTAEADLLAYLASGPRPPQLEEARILLSSLSAPHGLADQAATMARVRLLSDQPLEAGELLGGRCERSTAASRLVPLGVVLEWSGELRRAVECYREALRRTPNAAPPLARIAGVGARAPLGELETLEPELLLASARRIPPAEWALSRLASHRGDADGALARAERFLASADADDPSRPSAIAARDRIASERSRVRRERIGRRAAVVGALAVMLLAALFALFFGATLDHAIALRPSLYPEVARTIAELRHDVLKHRTSVLGLLVAGDAARSDVARVLLEPQPTSRIVAEKYERLRRSARSRGLALRALLREPVLGPLVRDLARAERLVSSRESDLSHAAMAAALAPIDGRLRTLHSERLGSLLRSGPRTRVDAATIAAWIRSAEAECRVRGRSWVSPVLLLSELDLEFPAPPEALATIFGNLLRNAQAAAAEDAAPSVIVRVGPERDALGRRVLVLLVGDSSRRELTKEMIDRGESGRGLGIVRDLVNEWRGHFILRAEDAPRAKGVGVGFPVAA